MTTIAATTEARLIKAEIELARAKSNKVAVAAGIKTENGGFVGFALFNNTKDTVEAKKQISKFDMQIRDLELRLVQVQGVC
jgi:hypothetical protein